MNQKEFSDLKAILHEHQNIFDSIPALIFYKDVNNRMVRVNKAFLDMTGLKREDVEGKSCFDIFPNQAKGYWNDDKEVVETDLPKKGIVEEVETCHGTRFFETNKIPFKDKDGNITGIVGFSVDIHDRIMVEAKLADKNKRLKAVDEVKSQFVANVSHEFRNPLSVIAASLEMMLDGTVGKIGPQQKKTLELANKTVKRLIRLVSDVLQLSRIEMGKLDIKRECFDLGELVDEILFSYEHEISKNGLSLEKDVPDDIGSIWGDRDKLTEVIINLLNNAIKYTPSKGKIAVKCKEEGESVRFEISDTGDGIPKDHLETIFDKFRRIIDVSKDGTGLGLSITKDIVELHKGRIWVESEHGLGSNFIFILPRDLRTSPVR
ncbi:MAG: PAS domain-containing sensor histidine kinase [Pseudomonadota bacterium]